MSAPDVLLADAIVADINSSSRSWSMDFVAERTWRPLWIGKEKLANLQCLINPWPIVDAEMLSRDESQFYYSVDFGFAKRLQEQQRDEIDDLRSLVNSVMNRYVVENIVISGFGTFYPQRKVDEYVTYDPSRLTAQHEGGRYYYTGDFLSLFRVPYYLRVAV